MCSALEKIIYIIIFLMKALDKFMLDSDSYYSNKEGQHHFGHACLKHKTCMMVGEGRNVGRFVWEEGAEAGEKMASWEPGEAQDKGGTR